MKTLEKKLLEMQIEVLIARRRAEDFKDEVVLNNVSHALGEAIKRFKGRDVIWDKKKGNK